METIEGGKAVVNVRSSEVEESLSKGLNDLNTNVKLLTQEMQHLSKTVETQVNAQSTLGKDMSDLRIEVERLKGKLDAQKEEMNRRLAGYTLLVAILAVVVPVLAAHWK